MKKFSKILLSGFLFILLSMQAQAQCFEQCDGLSDKLQDMHVLAAQAHGTAQQVYTFANNGNQNQLLDRITRLNGQLNQLSQTGRDIVSLPINDRILFLEMRELATEFEAIRGAWMTVSNAGNTTRIAAGASQLREDLAAFRGGPSEKRMGLCCMEP